MDGEPLYLLLGMIASFSLIFAVVRDQREKERGTSQRSGIPAASSCPASDWVCLYQAGGAARLPTEAQAFLATLGPVLVGPPRRAVGCYFGSRSIHHRSGYCHSRGAASNPCFAVLSLAHTPRSRVFLAAVQANGTMTPRPSRDAFEDARSGPRRWNLPTVHTA